MTDRFYFEYGDTELNWLKSRDAALAFAIDKIGHISRPVMPDLFEALVHSIVGQQISNKAVATIWARIQERVGTVTPNNIAELPVEELQQCGISMRKAGYIKEVAETVVSGGLNLDALRDMTDSEVCKRLSQIRGIGVWTAEMLMTFSMQRPDVMSWDDLAIHRGLRMLYRHRKITPALFIKYKRRYSPYGTVASLYLWAIAGGVCGGLSDLAQKKVKRK
jgi:DNA-3-methyladenine glycosylase II